MLIDECCIISLHTLKQPCRKPGHLAAIKVVGDDRSRGCKCCHCDVTLTADDSVQETPGVMHAVCFSDFFI